VLVRPLGSSKSGLFALKFGKAAPAMMERIEKAGSNHGITFSWDGLTGSSRDSHKLMLRAREMDAALAQNPGQPGTAADRWTERSIVSPSSSYLSAGTRTSQWLKELEPGGTRAGAFSSSPTTHAPRGVDSKQSHAAETSRSRLQDATMAALYRGHLELGRDVSQRAFLAETAVAVGIARDEAEALALLESDELSALVDQEAARAADAGVSAVPSYVVQGRYCVGGCQEPELFVSLFGRIQRSREDAHEEDSGAVQTAFKREI
jgi:predicted DsbA family dithiol-disulfide isomerase